MDGDGPLVDAVIKMVRFDQDRLLDNLAITGDLTLAQVEALARQVAVFMPPWPPIGIGPVPG